MQDRRQLEFARQPQLRGVEALLARVIEAQAR